ncbi:hypothetical protein FHR92_005239 [Fontibacillus solani]|uniref:Uncharacterized protein n=1 Tax=Fontibacillus solani TaxID=1572857 RepID=A0A7W3SYS2_9BACL|nr:hypothetical protein [Fontibacillus solani]MBA9088721.1 hypothetical protein [Fontibacillus solani]
MKKWAYIFGGFLLGAIVALSSQSTFAEVQSIVSGKEAMVDDASKTTSKIVDNGKTLTMYDTNDTKRVALGINDVADMSGFAFYGSDKNLKGQIYSLPKGFHIIAEDELLIRSFGQTTVQGDVVFEGNVKFKGTVDFSGAKVIGLK